MLRRLQLILFVFLVTGCGSYFTPKNPDVPRVQEDEEVRMGRQFRREIKQQLRLLNHPEVERYVDQVGRRVLSAMGSLPFDYRFFVVEDNQLNAFAVPGGSVYFYTGLIDRAKSTAELAGVMGHEIIHIKDKHMARLSGPDPLAILGVLAMILARGGAGAQAAGAIAQGLSATRQFAYTRQLELEADTLGVRYMAQAGYDPAAAVSFLKTMDQERFLNPVQAPAYLLTHPLTPERIANMERVVRSLNVDRPRAEGADPLKRIQTFIRLTQDEGVVVVAEYAKVIKRTPDNAEARHLLAIAQHHGGQTAPARENYEKARTLDPKRPGLDRDLARLYTQTGEFHVAHEALERAMRAEPREPLNFLYLGELYEKEANLREAASAYLGAANLSPLWPLPPYRVGVAYGKMGRLGDAHYYLGRSNFLQDEDERAIADFERAIKALGPNSPRTQLVREEMEMLKARRR